MAKETHSAIPSWSGYIYQGKLAIYEALRVIKKELSINNDFDFSMYSLEVEWQEDFSIKIGDDYKSIHQVKAYADGTSPAQYNDALKDLFRKVDNKICNIGFLNLWKPIGFTDRTVSRNFSELKEANKGTHTQEIIDKVEVYRYHTENETCDLSEADELIMHMIEHIYSLNNFGVVSLTQKQYEYILFNLYKLLDIHILEVHKKIRNKDDTILFNEIIYFFSINHEEYSNEYKFIKVKNKLLYLISRYCDDPSLCNNPTWSSEIDCLNCVLYKAEEKIEKMNSEQVYQLVLNSTPHYAEFQDLLNENGLKFGLIRIIHSLDETKREENFHFKDSSYYSPTSITEQRNSKEIAKKILENKKLDLIVDQYEVDTYISDNVNIDDLENEAKKLTNIDNDVLAEIYENRDQSKISKIKNIQIKSLDIVEEEINNAY